MITQFGYVRAKSLEHAIQESRKPGARLHAGGTDLLGCLRDNVNMAEAVMRALVRRLRNADRQIRSLALMDVYGRVGDALLDMAEEEADGTLVLRKKVSRQEVARMVGASREMVSRVMKHFEDNGLVQARGDGSFLLRPMPHTLE